ncbi:MAG: fasciclin domain-containing protein [Flavobacterium sp.]|jgi:uncharacterized surface protein with fasciclin (FAS1) repeats|uniref:fasciclin domain-containing protein n=1 Tax=Flavobacterium sp. TaxID=239 RepID=UPI003BA66523
MKKLNLLKTAFVAIFTVVAFSCSDDDSSSQNNTIAGIASRNPNLSSLVAALERAELTSTLNGSGSFTVFAPTNAAFTAFLNANGFANLEAVPVPVLKQILLNHVVSGSVQSSQLQTGYIKTLATYGGTTSGNTLSMYVNTASGVRLNGVSSVSTPNIIASNGVVHVVDAVIGLPTVVTFATADPTFNILEAALTREGDNITDFVTVLSGSGPFTVFAPTDGAFGNLLTELGAPSLAAIPESTLDPVLKYHVASGNVLSSALTPNGNTTVTTLQGQTFTITLPGTGGNIANVTDAANRASGIVAVDVQAANGVIHVLNKVILPGS